MLPLHWLQIKEDGVIMTSPVSLQIPPLEAWRLLFTVSAIFSFPCDVWVAPELSNDWCVSAV